MKRQLFALSFVFFVALLLGLAAGIRFLAAPLAPASPATGAPASSPVPPGVVFEGMVHHVGATLPALWVIDELPVTVTGDTVVITNGLAAQPGVWARVEAIKATGLHALKLDLQPVPTGDLYDRIAAIDPASGQWRVGQTLVQTGPGTVVTGADPSVGHLALVHGFRSGTGIDAERIVVVATDAEVFYHGTLTSMETATWLVDDVLVGIAPSTVFSGVMPSLGSHVQVRGIETGARRIEAAHIWTLDDATTPVHFYGWLQRIDTQEFPQLWRVNLLDGPRLRQVYVQVHEDTLVDETAGPAAPGAWLSGQAIYQGNAFYRAFHIAVLPRAPKRQFVEQVAALPSSGYTGIWQVGAYRVQVGPETGIVGAPQVGAIVWVSGTPDYANVIQAQLIEVLGE